MTSASNADDGVLSHEDLEMNAARRKIIADLVDDLTKIEQEIGDLIDIERTDCTGWSEEFLRFASSFVGDVVDYLEKAAGE
jgi:hypothetical protein